MGTWDLTAPPCFCTCCSLYLKLSPSVLPLSLELSFPEGEAGDPGPLEGEAEQDNSRDSVLGGWAPAHPAPHVFHRYFFNFLLLLPLICPPTPNTSHDCSLLCLSSFS